MISIINKINNNDKSIINHNKTKIDEYVHFLKANRIFRIENKYKNYDFLKQLNNNYTKEYCSPISVFFKDVQNVIRNNNNKKTI